MIEFGITKCDVPRILFLTVILIIAGCDRDGAVTKEPQLNIGDPDKFATYFNQQASLPAGSYKVIATTMNPGESGVYTLSITNDDGIVTTNSGQWSSSVGASSPFDVGVYDSAQIYSFSLDRAGGIQLKLETDLAGGYLYLLDRNNNVLFDSSSVYPGITLAAVGLKTVEINLPESIVNSVDYAKAYYAAIDPNNERDTLYKWRLANCFSNDPLSDFDADIHVIFRDTKDLGYGRNMYWKFGCDGQGGEDSQPGAVAVFVENFNVQLVPGLPYSTLNLDAAIANKREYHFGTNAIEFNNWRAGSSETKKFNKFYTFRPVSVAAAADEHRLDMVDLDDRGDKSMPVPCIYCHGGSALPFQADGNFYIDALSGVRGDTNAKLQALDIDKLEFIDTGAYTREQQEANLKIINQAVYCTYPGASASAFCAQLNSNFNVTFEATADAVTGEWSADFIRHVMQGWYGDDSVSKEFPAGQYDSTSLPPGWDPDNIANAGNPAGIDRLFLDVIQPSCMVCHSRQGSNRGSDSNASGDGTDVDLSSYDKFLTYTDKIEELVYDRGRMPLSLIGFEKFWETDQPSILASFLPNFNHFDDEGKVIPPGRPFADAGPDRELNVPAIISGEGSEFVESYLWSVIDMPAGAVPVLTGEDKARVSFDTDIDGKYTISLTVTQGDQHHTDEVVVDVNSSLTEPSLLTFEADIEPLVGVTASLTCDDCHSDTSVAPGVQGTVLGLGVPAVWDGSGVNSAYHSVMSRVYLNDPADSLLLRKATGEHHYGGTLIDLDTSNGVRDYNTILSWIIEGAIEK